MSDKPTGLFGLENCPLHRNTPFGIQDVSRTQFSVARHYGGIKYNGSDYTYLPATDELIRDDVLKWRAENAKASGKIVKKMEAFLESADLTPEATTLLKMAIEAQETGKMPSLPITLQPMPTPP